jgi:hypothetical protein
MANASTLMSMGLSASLARHLADSSKSTSSDIDSLRLGGLKQATSPGIMIPLYLYPANPYSDPTMQGLLSLIRQYRSIPTVVIVNPSNGPGAVWDGNYAAAIRLLKAAGAKVVGYVSTDYATRAKEEVLADVVAWQKLYVSDPVDGIFLDEQPWATGTNNVNVKLYQEYTDYCHERGLYPVVANPGTNQQGAWFAGKTADIIVVHENNAWPAENDMAGNFTGGHADYGYVSRAAMVYGQATLDAYKLRRLRRYVNWVYVTNDGGGNPWDTVSSHLAALYAALADSDSACEGLTPLTYAATTAWDAGETTAATVTLTGNTTMAAPTNLLPGRVYRLIATQDGTGNRTLAFNAAYKFPVGTTLPLTGTANQKIVVEFLSDGASLYALTNNKYA